MVNPLHASSDIRIVKCLDGLHYSFETLSYIYSSLHEICSKIKDDSSSLIPALWQCWSFVDIVFRIREIGQSLPGLNKRNKDLVMFLDETILIEDYRHYIQHLRGELTKKEANPFPVWGSLTWTDTNDPLRSYIVFIGAQTADISYTGSVFDIVEQKWVSRVCLGILGKSLNFDPMYASCIQFRDFVIPWILSTYEPGIKLTTRLPIVTMQAPSLKKKKRMPSE